ncbi:MAG: glutamate--tRNA ligase [Anaerolineales bacterium]
MTKLTQPARVRFAPSPTGRLHIGSGRTALFNYLLARQTGGQFILRLEDTDRKRYKPESEQEIIDGLHWLGIEWDEGFDIGGPYGPYRQTERKEIYQKYARQLAESGHAYYCFCTPQRLHELRQDQQKKKMQPRYDGLCRGLTPEEADTRIAAGESHVVRFKMPRRGTTTVTDAIRGDITVENRTLDDYIIVKSDGLALYHLAVVVDDHLMKITHVFRTVEWLATFPLHVQLYKAFGWEQPAWVHPSVFLKPSGKGKMSKRDSAQMAKSGQSIFVTDLEALGYLPEAVVNWIVLMGWSYDDKTEFFTMDDLIEKFSIGKLNPAPAAINFSKFDHFNGLHIRSLNTDDLAARAKPFFERAGYQPDDETLRKIAPIVQERIKTLDDAPIMAGFFFKENVTPPKETLIPRKTTPEEALAVAERALTILESLPDITHNNTEHPLRGLAEEMGLKAGQVFGVLRSAVTGQRVSPPLFESMEIIGREKVLERVRAAIEILRATC